jgi:hypothetical protein
LIEVHGILVGEPAHERGDDAPLRGVSRFRCLARSGALFRGDCLLSLVSGSLAIVLLGVLGGGLLGSPVSLGGRFLLLLTLGLGVLGGRLLFALGLFLLGLFTSA